MVINRVEQSPVTLSVGNRIVRAGSYPPGYRIINQDVRATVWASQNPGMQAGQGTPINPGTSLTWAQEGDIYLILGNDAASVDAVSATVTLSYDVGDWQPNPVVIAAAASNLTSIIFNANSASSSSINATMANQFNGPIDASLFGSVVMRVGPQGGTTPTANIRIDQYSSRTSALLGGSGVWFLDLNWYSITTVVETIIVPIYAPFIVITLVSNNPTTDLWFFEAYLNGNQVAKPIYQTYAGNGRAGCLLDFLGGVLGAGGASNQYFDVPYGGLIEVQYTFSWAAVPALPNSRVEFFVNNTVNGQNRVGHLTPDSLAHVQVTPTAIEVMGQLVVPADQILCRVVNQSASATQAWDLHVRSVELNRSL